MSDLLFSYSSVKLSPNPDYYTWLAYAYAVERRYDEAIETVYKIPQSEGVPVVAVYVAGCSLVVLGEIEKAKQAADMLMRLSPELGKQLFQNIQIGNISLSW